MAPPKQKRGHSRQDYGTPWEFITAVVARFGEFVCDLAANASNAKCKFYFSEANDSLVRPWAEMFPGGNLWLNPEFRDIAPWAEKCALEAPRRRGRILLLTPASIGTDWFARHVHGKALVLGLSPRMTFEGTPPNPKTGKVDPYPKDLMLSVFGQGYCGFDLWRWK